MPRVHALRRPAQMIQDHPCWDGADQLFVGEPVRSACPPGSLWGLKNTIPELVALPPPKPAPRGELYPLGKPIPNRSRHRLYPGSVHSHVDDAWFYSETRRDLLRRNPHRVQLGHLLRLSDPWINTRGGAEPRHYSGDPRSGNTVFSADVVEEFPGCPRRRDLPISLGVIRVRIAPLAFSECVGTHARIVWSNRRSVK